MTNDRVSVQVAGPIADVVLNRPDKLNALDGQMFTALSEASAALARRGDVRAVVLSGSGRGFCAGIDLAALGGVAVDDLMKRTHGTANVFQNAVWGWRQLPVPVIAAIHGIAFGGGLQIALGADMRIVAPDARLSVMEARWGLVPDMGGIALLRGLVRDDIARDLTYTARQVSGIEAVELGLATRAADDPRATAMEIAAQIAGNSPRAVRGAKRLFALSQDSGAGALLLAESREQQELLAGPDLAEIITARAGQRPPRFADLRKKRRTRSAPIGLQFPDHRQGGINMPADIDLRVDDVPDDAVTVDHVGDPARQQAEGRRDPVTLANPAALIAEQREGELMMARERGVAFGRVGADPDHLGPDIGEHLQAVTESACLPGAAGGLVLGIEVQDHHPLAEPVAEPHRHARL